MTTTAAAITMIRRDSKDEHKRTLQELLADAGTWRPLGFASSQARRRDHLVGNGSQHVKAKLKKLYPQTWERIEPLPYNFARHSARTGASFYDEPPTRVLIDPLTSTVVPGDDLRSLAFAEAIDQSRARVVLAAADERAEWMGDAVIAVRARESWDAASQSMATRLRCELHWADNAWVLPDAAAPADLQRAGGFVLKIKTARNGRACDAYEVWTRAEGGPWTVSTQLGDGAVLIPQEEYTGHMLPFVIMHAEATDGLPFVERGDDDVDMIEMLVVGQSDAAHIGRMQGHTDRVYRGTRKKPHELVGGPDATIQIDTGEELTALAYSPALEALDAGNVKQMKTWALTKEHPVHSYTVDGQAPESGFARAIANEARDRMQRRRDALIVEKEESEILPIIAEVWTMFVDADRPLTGLRFKVAPKRSKPHEDLEARQRRLQADLNLGVVSLATYAVEMGHFASLADAIAAGLPDRLGAAVVAAVDGAPVVSPLRARLEAQRAARGEVADEVGDGT